MKKLIIIISLFIYTQFTFAQEKTSSGHYQGLKDYSTNYDYYKENWSDTVYITDTVYVEVERESIRERRKNRVTWNINMGWGNYWNSYGYYGYHSYYGHHYWNSWYYHPHRYRYSYYPYYEWNYRYNRWNTYGHYNYAYDHIYNYSPKYNYKVRTHQRSTNVTQIHNPLNKTLVSKSEQRVRETLRQSNRARKTYVTSNVDQMYPKSRNTYRKRSIYKSPIDKPNVRSNSYPRNYSSYRYKPTKSTNTYNSKSNIRKSTSQSRPNYSRGDSQSRSNYSKGNSSSKSYSTPQRSSGRSSYKRSSSTSRSFSTPSRSSSSNSVNRSSGSSLRGRRQ